MEHKKYHTVRTILKIQQWQNNSNIQSKIVERETLFKHRSFSWIGRDTSIYQNVDAPLFSYLCIPPPFFNHKYRLRPIKLVKTQHFSIEVTLPIQENERCLDLVSVSTIFDWILELFWQCCIFRMFWQYGIFCVPFYYIIIKWLFCWRKSPINKIIYNPHGD
jgi:hypothetical protein